jgi:hypothetical protein
MKEKGISATKGHGDSQLIINQRLFSPFFTMFFAWH